MNKNLHSITCSNRIIRAAIFVLFISALCGMAAAQESSEPAPEPPKWYNQVTLNGFVSASYLYNFNDPASDTNQFRVFDFDHNSFKIDVAELVIQKTAAEAGSAGFRVDLEAGSSIPRISAARGLFRNETTGQAEDFDLQQAYVTYNAPAGNGIAFDFGKFTSPFGAEVIEGYDGWNDNYSRSFLFGYAVPFTHTGLRVGYSFSPKVTGTFILVNGWDNVKDNNGGKSWGGQATFAPADSFKFIVGAITGPERDGNDDDSRTLLDMTAIWKPSTRISVSANYDYGIESSVLEAGDDANFWGFAGYLRWNLNDRCALAFRGEYLDDSDGTRTGVAQTLKEFTITPEFRMTDSMILRFEYRTDFSDQDVFLENDGFADSQPTIAINALYSF